MADKLTPVPDLAVRRDVSDMARPVPLLDPDTGAPLGADMTIGQVFLGILAVVRRTRRTLRGNRGC